MGLTPKHKEERHDGSTGAACIFQRNGDLEHYLPAEWSAGLRALAGAHNATSTEGNYSMETIEKSEIKIQGGGVIIKMSLLRNGVFAGLPNDTEIDTAIEWLNGFRKN